MTETELETGWSEEDQQIWRDRKMKPHTIRYRYQQHMKEYQVMLNLTRIPINPSHAKFIALQFMPHYKREW